MIHKLEIGLKAVIEAGREIQKIYKTDFTVRMKGKNDPVTQADMESHYKVKSAIQENFPKDFLLSEEDIPTWESRKDFSHVWILDPLDGTRDFVERNPEFAISLGYTEKGLSKLGIIYNPISMEIFLGGQGLNFFSNKLLDNEDPEIWLKSIQEKLKIIPSHTKNLNIPENNKIQIYVSNNEFKEGLFDFLKLDTDYSIKGVGSIAYKLGLLARGDCDLLVSLKPKNEWDICAGIGIINSIGLESLDLKFLKPHSFNNQNTKTFGFIAGKKQIINNFLKKYQSRLQESLKDWYN